MGKKRRFLATTKLENAKGKGVWTDLTDNWSGNPFEKDSMEASIDKTNHIVKNVCVFGSRHSLNGYTYQDKAIESLGGFTNGAKFFINHPSESELQDRDGTRDIRHWAGVFFNARQESDKVFADLKVRPAYFDLVYDVATMQPNGVGNSINSRVKVFQNEKGEESIVDMDHLKSIDLVADAATTTSLFESRKEIKDTTELQRRDFDEFIKEGLLLDRIKEREAQRKINDLTWEAGDIIRDVLRADDKDMGTKKLEINSIVDDLGTQIGAMTAMMSENDNKPTTTKQNKEDDDMDFKALTLAQITTEAPHIIDAIKATMEDVSKQEALVLENDTLKTANTDLTTKMEELTTKFDELTTKFEALTTASDEMKTKLDEYETAAKSEAKRALIDTKITESKLATEAVSDVYIQDLMLKDEKDIDASIADRKNLWAKGSGKVKNLGESNKQPDMKDENMKDEDMKTASENFMKAFK